MPTPRRIDGLRVLVHGVALPMETFLDRLFTGLADRGAALTVVSPIRPPADWLAARRAGWHHGPGRLDGRAVGRELAARGPRAAAGLAADLVGRSARGGTSLGRLIARARPDVVYSPWINTLVNHPEVLDCGVPIVVSCRGRMITIDPWDPELPDQADGLRRTFARVDAVHCVSRAMEAEAATFGLDPRRSTVITPAVDPSVFRPGEDRPAAGGRLDVVSVGSLIWRKDHERSLLAVRRARELGADVHLRILGEGPDREHLTFALLDLDLVDHVELVGSQTPDQVAGHLRSADALLHTSSSEGISNAVLEAMASGLPVVTSDAGGMGEAVRDGRDGFVVPRRDVEGYARALHRLAGDPALARRLGASARERVVDRFTLDRQLDRFGALLAATAEARR